MGLMDKIRGYVSFLCELSNVNHYEWHVAIRKRGEKTLYHGNGEGFAPVSNDWRYWRADPFLFRHQDKDYLFVEMYDRWKRKGVIGVCRIRNGKCGRFRVCLDLPWHLSYPCIFEDQQGIHMVPECSASGELWMYRCRKFPMKWEKERCIAKESVADATPFETGRGRLWFATAFFKGSDRRNDNLSVCSEVDGTGIFTPVIKNDETVRPAGHFVEGKDGWLRPSQNCANTYGGHLIFHRVDKVGESAYQESSALSVYPPDADCICDGRIVVSCSPRIGTGYDGVHTYNLNEKYEVVDLKYKGARNGISFLRNLGAHYFSK